MTSGFSVALAVLVGPLVFAWFVRLERRGHSMTPVLIILGLLVVESVIYPDPNKVPAGLFHPGGGINPDGSPTGSAAFRLPDLLIPLALAAMLVGRRKALRLEGASLWWLAFAIWLGAAAVTGTWNGNSTTLVTFEGKSIIYIGFFLLAGGVPATQYAHGRMFRRFLYGSAALAFINILLNELHARIAVNLPGLQIQELGLVGTDAATIFLGLGLIAAAIAICSDRGRLRLLIAAVPLIFASIVTGQRAALIALGVSLASVTVLALFSRRRIRCTPTEFFLAAATFAALLLSPVLGSAVIGKREPVAPFVESVKTKLENRGKQLSAQDRLNQWAAAKKKIKEHVFLGSGLGTTYEHYDPGVQAFVTTDITHNIGLDILMRTGLIGLWFFLVALCLTVRDGVRVWRGHQDGIVGAVAVACTAMLVGLIAKGMVESIFEKFRLAVFLGFLIGVVASGFLSVTEPVAEEAPESRFLAPGRAAWR